MRSFARVRSPWLVALLLLAHAWIVPVVAQDPIVPDVPPLQEPPVVPEPPAPETAPPQVPGNDKPKPVDDTVPKSQKLVVAIRVEGERRYTEGQLLAALGQKVGEPVDAAVVQKGLATLWDAFSVYGSVKYREVEGGVELWLQVEEMNADLEPRFVGNEEIKTETLKRWALLEAKGELFLYQAQRVRHRLLEGYHKEGFDFVEIDVVRRGSESGAVQSNELPDVIFEIREGPRVRVKGVVVHGSRSMPDTGMWWWKDGLKKLARIELSGPWLLNWYGDKFVRDTLDADILAMREVYRDRGFLDAIVELDRLEYTDDRSGVVIHIVVDEGRPYTVTSLSIEGVKRTWNSTARDFDEADEPLLFSTEELLALCAIAPGKGYERTRQNADAAALREFYGARGYLSHPSLGSDYFEFLEPRLTFDPATHSVAVTYRLAQGRKRYVREVLFQGAQHTRDRVLRREVDMLPGEVADLTKIRKALSSLFNTGYFTDETTPLEHRDPTFSFKPTDNADWVDLEYAVEEGKVVLIQLQGGVTSDEGLFGQISLSLRNFDVTDTPTSLWSTFGDLFQKEAFHGAGQELEIELRPGTEEDYYRVRFSEPDIFRTHFKPWSLDAELNRRTRPERFYDEDRKEIRVRLGHKFSRKFSAFVGYTYQELDVTDLDSALTGLNDPVVPPLPDSIYQQEGRTNLTGLTFDMHYRDLDQFQNPRAGKQLVSRNYLYGGAFGGDYDFVKSSLELDWFWLAGAEVEEVRPGFHLGLGGGVADNYGQTSLVPYTERFFLGGSKTLRGFDRRGVGPNRGDNTLGGATYLASTLEYRYPLHSTTQPGSYKQIETFRLTLFSDAGVLGVDPWDVDPEEVRWTYGFGLGMVHPFPISLNFGFPILSGDGDREQVFSFTILSLWF